MEHELTIASSAGLGTEPEDEPMHLMAQTDIVDFEDEGYPDAVTGKLIDVPQQLLREVGSGRGVRVELGGRTYKFADLDDDGTFRLVKDRSAEVFGSTKR